jgi:hypothetical protein
MITVDKKKVIAELKRRLKASKQNYDEGVVPVPQRDIDEELRFLTSNRPAPLPSEESE